MGSKDIILDFKDSCYNLVKDKPLKKEDITLSLAKVVLEKHIGKQEINRIDVEHVIKTVARIMKVKEKAILGKGRNMEIALARQICMFIAKELTKLS